MTDYCNRQKLNVTSSLHVFRDVESLGIQMRSTIRVQQQSITREWKLAKVAFVVIVVYVLSWSPYAFVTLVAWAGYLLL